MNIKIGNLFKGDKVIWMVLLFLCIISIVEVFSASSSLTYKSQDYLGPILGHSWKIFMGVVVALFQVDDPRTVACLSRDAAVGIAFRRED